jgi:NTP pyrophosphatase (non-canonical NTP hydrolase)
MTTTPLKFLSIESTFNSNNNTKKPIIKRIYKLFNKKYSKMPKSYNMNIIDNIIYNEKSHIVAVFKDRLIIDDTGEFLKRYYKIRESNIRLPKFYEYYELYSKIFPNYTAFYEGKYLYQNIQRKQRMIDLQERLEMEEFNDEDKSKSSRYENKEKVFNTEAIDSILNGTNNEGMEIIFNVNKNNIKQDEENFKKEINDIIDVINNYEIKNKLTINKKYSNHEIKNNNNINKNASIPLNLNYSKTKRLRNSNSIILNNNNTNNTYYNNIQSIISKFFKIPSHKKNGILTLHNNLNEDSKVDGKSKL